RVALVLCCPCARLVLVLWRPRAMRYRGLILHPGYLPVPLDPGLWHVQLGLHQLPLEPVDTHVEVFTPATPPVPAEPDPPPAAATPRASARDLPAPAGLRWDAGDFHAHSTHSDGEQDRKSVV